MRKIQIHPVAIILCLPIPGIAFLLRNVKSPTLDDFIYHCGNDGLNTLIFCVAVALVSHLFSAKLSNNEGDLLDDFQS